MQLWNHPSFFIIFTSAQNDIAGRGSKTSCMLSSKWCIQWFFFSKIIIFLHFWKYILNSGIKSFSALVKMITMEVPLCTSAYTMPFLHLLQWLCHVTNMKTWERTILPPTVHEDLLFHVSYLFSSHFLQCSFRWLALWICHHL